MREVDALDILREKSRHLPNRTDKMGAYGRDPSQVEARWGLSSIPD